MAIMAHVPGEYKGLDITISDTCNKDKSTSEYKDFVDIRFRTSDRRGNYKTHFKRFTFTRKNSYASADCILALDLIGLVAKLNEVKAMKANADAQQNQADKDAAVAEGNRIRKVESVKAELNTVLEGWKTSGDNYPGREREWRRGDIKVYLNYNGEVKIEGVNVEIVKGLIEYMHSPKAIGVK
jgi:hypothetical protein